MLKLKLMLKKSGHLMQRSDWLKKTLMLGKINSEGQRSLVCCSPWGHAELDMTEQQHTSNIYVIWYIYHIYEICIYVHNTFLINLFIDTWLLWTVLQWTWEYRYLSKILMSFPLYLHLEVWYLDHIEYCFSFFWETFIQFSIMATQICTPTNSLPRFPFLYVFINICYFLPFW